MSSLTRVRDNWSLAQHAAANDAVNNQLMQIACAPGQSGWTHGIMTCVILVVVAYSDRLLHPDWNQFTNVACEAKNNPEFCALVEKAWRAGTYNSLRTLG